MFLFYLFQPIVTPTPLLVVNFKALTPLYYVLFSDKGFTLERRVEGNGAAPCLVS